MAGRRTLVASASGLLAAAALGAAPAASEPLARWHPLVAVRTIVDVVGPRADGRLVVSTRSGLLLLRPGGALEPFARGPDGYAAEGGEPYVALAPARRLAGAHCSFHRDDVFALDADSSPGVVRVLRDGRATRLADLPAGAFPSGIAFDTVGRFGYRLLVAAELEDKTTLYALDCLGRLTAIVQGAAHVEGGMAVAPLSFGRFGGDLIAADESSGRLLAFDPGGSVRVVAASGLEAGGDVGVEGVGFVPPRLGASGAAYFSDLTAPGSPTPGTGHLLVLRGQELARARLAPGELVAATEAGAKTIAVRCARTCAVRLVATGPAAAHGEGHVTFVP